MQILQFSGENIDTSARFHLTSCLIAGRSTRLMQRGHQHQLPCKQEKRLLGKYACPVDYYVASWIFDGLSLVVCIIAREMQSLYCRFADKHMSSKETAETEHLTVPLVKKRLSCDLMFSSSDYFELFASSSLCM